MSISINGQQIESFKFSGGEIQVKLNSNVYNDKLTNVDAELNSADDIMELLLIVDVIRRYAPDTKIYLTIPYFPYARQDRPCNPSEALSVKVMANLINSMNCDRVIIFDPHSDVTPALINNCYPFPWFQLPNFMKCFKKLNAGNLTIVSPDAGAQKKIYALCKSFKMFFRPNFRPNVVLASKKRDVATGEIYGTEAHGDIDGRDMIIIDDICDGGRTFLSLANILKSKGARDLYLSVTHGIFSKGFDELKENFKHIYCYHLVGQHIEENKKNISSDFITILGDLKNED